MPLTYHYILYNHVTVLVVFILIAFQLISKCPVKENHKSILHNWFVFKHNRIRWSKTKTDLKKQLPSAVTWMILRPKASSWARNWERSQSFPCFFFTYETTENTQITISLRRKTQANSNLHQKLLEPKKQRQRNWKIICWFSRKKKVWRIMIEQPDAVVS